MSREDKQLSMRLFSRGTVTQMIELPLNIVTPNPNPNPNPNIGDSDCRTPIEYSDS